jgi:hypothetical protein
MPYLLTGKACHTAAASLLKCGEDGRVNESVHPKIRFAQWWVDRDGTMTYSLTAPATRPLHFVADIEDGLEDEPLPLETEHDGQTDEDLAAHAFRKAQIDSVWFEQFSHRIPG